MQSLDGMVQTNCYRWLLILLVLTLTTVGTTKADDGWRRTAHGWERTTVWQGHRTTRQPVVVAKSDPIHPGQLAIWQVALSCLVLGLFIGERQIH